MELKEFLPSQFDREAVGTRTAIERMSEGHDDWKPRRKSMDLGYLAALGCQHAKLGIIP
jgi:hypothetical protein